MTPTRPKVFCVGFHKTGTKSLGAALATLGYRVAGPRGTLDPQIAIRMLAAGWAAVERGLPHEDAR